jgi:cell wall-associated NlpC family hydrolase
MSRKVGIKITSIVLCLAVIFLWSSASSARRSSHARHSKQKIHKVVRVKKAAGHEEKSAIVTTPSSDVFARDSQESERVTQVLLGDEFVVVTEDKDWAYGYIPSQKGYRGWIRKDNILFSTKNSPFKNRTFVRVENARARITFRDGSFLNVYAGTRLPLLNKDNRRYEVAMPGGSVGYLAEGAALIENEHPETKVTAKDILRASKFYGSDYKWGGITRGGMDCSGFVYTAFRLNGIFLKRDSYMQAEDGLDVPMDKLEAGDLVFFKSKRANRINHVGIYIGNGNFIHSSRGRSGVAVSSLSEQYFKNNFACARRVLNHADNAVPMMKDMEPSVKQTPKNES